jgi:methionine aminopeptidase
VFYNGFHGDLNETFFVGNVDADSRRLVECAYKTLAAGIAMVKPGALYRLVRVRYVFITHATDNSILAGKSANLSVKLQSNLNVLW